LHPNSDPSDMFNRFYYKLSEITDKHIPIKKLPKNKQITFSSKPWFSKGIQTSIKIKNKIYRKYLKTKSTYLYCKFKFYRYKINHLVKINKKKYYNDYFSQNSNDGKKIWSGIKTLVQYKQKKNY